MLLSGHPWDGMAVSRGGEEPVSVAPLGLSVRRPSTELPLSGPTGWWIGTPSYPSKPPPEPPKNRTITALQTGKYLNSPLQLQIPQNSGIMATNI